MEPENLRENWEILGDVFYEISEVYEMEWVDKVIFLIDILYFYIMFIQLSITNLYHFIYAF